MAAHDARLFEFILKRRYTPILKYSIYMICALLFSLTIEFNQI